MGLLTVHDLAVSFHTREGIVQAVDGAGFELDRGRTLGIVGESGSGKSVLCSSLLGLLPTPPARIDRGEAVFDGKNLLGMPPKRLRAIRGNRISMVFQDPMTSLNPYLRIGRQLIEPLALHKNITGKQAWNAAIEALADVGLPNPEILMRKYPHQLSGGMRQRVMIAMALITRPDILIADEPTTALDVTIQAQILALIRKLQREYDIAVIFVSHDLGVIAGIADYVLVMQSGKVVEEGAPAAVFHQTRHPYTRKLLSSIPTRAKTAPYPRANRFEGNLLLGVSNLRTWFGREKPGLLEAKTSTLVKAVDDVSLQVYRGETLGLVGESGSGKSTLGRSVMRLVDITGGIVTLDNRNLALLKGGRLKRARHDLQMIFQDPYASLNPRMTVYDTLAEALQVRGVMSSRDLLAGIVQLMQDVGLKAADIRKYPHEFSGGQRQRNAIARALAVRPKLIIADEPVSALDVTIQAQILELLLELARRRELSMLFISHDLSVVRYMTDRVAVMYRGKIVETGDTEAVFQSPQHPYTQKLLKAIPVPDPERQRQRYEELEKEAGLQGG